VGRRAPAGAPWPLPALRRSKLTRERAFSPLSTPQRTDGRSRFDCPYETLGVTPSATPAEVKKAFRAAARAHHPDVAAGAGACSTTATARFMKVAEAYAILSGRGARFEKMRAAADARGSAGAGRGAVWSAFDDWYWSFTADRTNRRKAAAAGGADDAPSANRAPAGADALAAQLAGLRARAARKAAAATASASAAPAAAAEATSSPPAARKAAAATASASAAPAAAAEATSSPPDPAAPSPSPSPHRPGPRRGGADPETHARQLAGLRRKGEMRKTAVRQAGAGDA